MVRRGPQVETIPRYALYGEPGSLPASGFVHIEDIEARSGPAGWHIKPHRHAGMFQVLCISQGGAVVTVDADEHSLDGAWALTLPSGCVHGFRFDPGTRGHVLTCADTLLDALGRDLLPTAVAALARTPQRIDCRSEPLLFAQLEQYLQLLAWELGNHRAGNIAMLQLLVVAVLVTLQRQDAPGSTRGPGGAATNQQGLVQAFRTLLDAQYRSAWTVEQYAAALRVSSSTLNRACHAVLELSAKQLVQQRLLHEAKRRLIYTGEPLESIAWSLGYRDPAYFSRVFRRLAGDSPSAFRLRHNIGNGNGTT
jgi:AraC family transcriptional activator of pobA